MNHQRHPGGRTCNDKRVLLMVVLLMPYAMVRYAIDCLRGKP